MSKKKEIGFSNLTKIKPVTDNQQLVFESWKKNKLVDRFHNIKYKNNMSKIKKRPSKRFINEIRC